MTWQEKILEKIKIIKCLKRERGSILVLTALLLPILFGCLGIAYDVGTLYMHKARLQNVTDAAALAGGRAYLQSQKKDNNNDKDTYDPYTNGNITDEEYVIGGSKTRVRRRPGEDIPDDDNIHTFHLDADNAADVYIYNNIINLGNKVYSDKFSHYALPGYKKRGDDYVNADEIFYRIGLYEKVPLYFLPVITNKNVEIVRAGSVVVVKPGTTTTDPGSGGGSSTITHSSIFDNLFTYSVDFFSQNVMNNSEVYSSYEGDIVYTYMNSGSSDGTPLEQLFYYSNNPADNDDIQRKNHLYTATGTASNTLINDPQINTFYNTEEYMSAFKKLLLGPHYDIDEQVFTLTGNYPVDNESKDSCLASRTETSGADNGREYWYIKTDRTFYRIVDKNAVNKTYSFVRKGEEDYKICYHPYPSNAAATNNLILCGKKDDDSRFYLLKTTGAGTYEVTNEYIGEVLTTTATSDQWGNVTRNTQWSSDTSISLDAIKSSGIYTWCDNINLTSTSGQGGNVYHVTRACVENSGNGGIQNITIYIDAPLEGDENEPVYIIIDDDMTQVKIRTHNSNVDTRRPVIVVYSGSPANSGQFKFDFIPEGEKTTSNVFRGTLYIPYTDMETSNFNGGTFRGNIIAKHVKNSSGQGAHWIQQNYLDDVNADIKAVSDAVAGRIKEANKKLTDTIKQKLVDAFDGLTYEAGNQWNPNPQTIHVTADDLGNMTWYNNLSYKEKQAIYVKWKELYDDENNSAIRDLLWPWNEHFDIDISEGGQPVIVPEILRLINYRTEYQPEETIQENDVLDPYIYETLGQPNSYGL